ncbi:hypothetical protein P154DRAFT_532927 [Amniculicola lignicola CBS 123094]|uniref:Uncharacterized protein n=1 Tax=Amniculicola lignicola CBS 123094 TaxID=1392246 RepID=A0A6A5WNW4_9PLEO|nr:hypothetical protein P154DRAFT_532927 [Amniculicola lignicola CBS 123094]
MDRSDSPSVADTDTIKSFELPSPRNSTVFEIPISLDEDEPTTPTLAEKRVTATEFFISEYRSSDSHAVCSTVPAPEKSDGNQAGGNMSPVSMLHEDGDFRTSGEAPISHQSMDTHASSSLSSGIWPERNSQNSQIGRGQSDTFSGASSTSLQNPISELFRSTGEEPSPPPFQTAFRPLVRNPNVPPTPNSHPPFPVSPFSSHKQIQHGSRPSNQTVSGFSPGKRELISRNKVNEQRSIPNSPSGIAEQELEGARYQAQAHVRFLRGGLPPSQLEDPRTNTRSEMELGQYDYGPQTTSTLNPTRAGNESSIPSERFGSEYRHPYEIPIDRERKGSTRRSHHQIQQQKKLTENEERRIVQAFNRKFLAVYKEYQAEAQNIKHDASLTFDEKQQRARTAEERMRNRARAIKHEEIAYDFEEENVAIDNAVAKARGDHPPPSQQDSELVKAVKWIGIKAWRSFRWFIAVPNDPALKSYSRRYGLAELAEVLPLPLPYSPPSQVTLKRASSESHITTSTSTKRPKKPRKSTDQIKRAKSGSQIATSTSSKKARKPKKSSSHVSIAKLTDQIKARMDATDDGEPMGPVPGMSSVATSSLWPTQSEVEGTVVHGSDGRRF